MYTESTTINKFSIYPYKLRGQIFDFPRASPIFTYIYLVRCIDTILWRCRTFFFLYLRKEKNIFIHLELNYSKYIFLYM